MAHFKRFFAQEKQLYTKLSTQYVGKPSTQTATPHTKPFEETQGLTV